MKKITGHLEEDKGKWYAAVNHYDPDGKRHVKWYNLDVEAKRGNKRKAEERLTELLEKLNRGTDYLSESLTPAERERLRLSNSPVDEYLVEWLEDHKRNITTRTYEGYKSYIDQRIVPYFREKHILVKDMTGDNINAFYRYLTEQGLKGTSQQRYHSVLHLAFKTAVKRRIIPANPVDQADRPKSKPFISSYYNADEMKKLLEIAEKDELHLVILLTAYYGLRRSEVLGLKWSAIDFTDKKIAIRHKVLEESGEIHGYDVMKTKSSYRTLPLIPVVEEALRNQIRCREEMKKAFRKGYCTDFDEYICTDALGRLYRPDYVSEHFALLLKKNGLRHIRFHELRHSCASLLLAKKVPMKMIQEWLGHSDISTTSNIYSHLDAESKLESADIIGAALSS
ncbi:MAG: site-specific integrase [Clostridia bacterium]|nr:site-specific integrase [Clostridia bacterium]